MTVCNSIPKMDIYKTKECSTFQNEEMSAFFLALANFRKGIDKNVYKEYNNSATKISCTEYGG